MNVKERKHNARGAKPRSQSAVPTKAGVRARTCPKNRVARYFRDWPTPPAGPKVRRARQSEQLERRRERARRIADLPLEYMPSGEFRRTDAEKRIVAAMPAADSAARKMRAPAGLPPYLASLYETPLLTAEQERHLFRKYNYLKYRAAKLREKLNPTRPQIRLMNEIERLHREAVATKNQIIQANLRLVVSIMKRYVTENEGTFELISDGNISLLRAVEKFDYTRGAKFSTYATWAIQKNNARQFADDIKRRIRFQTSQDEALAASPQEHFDPVQAERAQDERAERVAGVLAHLDRRDRQIIEARFGLAGNLEAKTLKEVGNELGVSKERVRQLEQRAMERLRELAREANLVDSLN
jgi:RNA polymerase primary sigma factor/RNA polymerase sigma factor